MLMVISPAKTLDLAATTQRLQVSQPTMLDQSEQLISLLKQKSPADIAKLMSISDALAVLNVGRYHDWQRPFDEHNAKPAVLAFMGDVYEGLDASSLSIEELNWLQAHLRILSGLYGVLRPLDLMQAYRLEMGTKLTNPRGKDLYAFWGDLVSRELNQALSQASPAILINLASNEYFKAVTKKVLHASIITPQFLDQKNGEYKVISFYAKRARGLMVRWAVKHAVTEPEQLKAFDSEGYHFDVSGSDATNWLFRREENC